MNQIVKIGVYFSQSEFVLKCKDTVKQFYYCFNSLDSVSLTFIIFPENEAGRQQGLYTDVIKDVIDEDFFFLKTLPDLNISIFHEGSQVFRELNVILNSDTYKQADVLNQNNIPVIQPFCQAILDFVFSITHHKEDFFIGQSSTNSPDFLDLSEETKQVDEYWGGGMPHKSVNDIYFSKDHAGLGCTFPEYIAKLGSQLPSVDRAVSLGCGSGKFERDILKAGLRPNTFEAFDVSSNSVNKARKLAAEGSFNCLNYFVRDINYFNLTQNSYDLVLANDNLHHFHNLERVFWEVSRGLKTHGLFIIYDWFGASRMQFSDKQISYIDTVVKIIPEKFRVHVHEGTRYLKNEYLSPMLEAMIQVDYTEGIRSSEIAGLLNDNFNIIERFNCGGSILPHAFLLIENNFKPDNPQHVEIVEKLIEYEQSVIKSGELESDYRIYVCTKK